MDPLNRPEQDFDQRFASRLLEVLIRAGLILALAWLCLEVFAPFMTLMIWALILAVTLYPLHQALARRVGGRQGLAAVLISIAGVGVIVAPTAVLLNSMGDSVHQLVSDVQQNTLQIPPPPASVQAWPLVGEKLHAAWTTAHADLPALVKSLQPKLGELTRSLLGMVASIGGGLLKFVAAFLLSGVVMAFGEAGARAGTAIFVRVVGAGRGVAFARLSVATIRAVAQGVVGVAFIQAIVVGLCLLVAGVPWAGVLAGVVLVLGIAQVPALLVTLPAIVWLWTGAGMGNVAAGAYSVLLFVAGMTDNVLKPLMLGRGVDAPMPVILIGALGGMATAGILGMFVGATLLALGYQIFTGWVSAGTSEAPIESASDETQAEGDGTSR